MGNTLLGKTENMKKYFITATGTNVGKTLITTALTWQLKAQGKKVHSLKPISSGFNDGSLAKTDAGQLLLAQGLELTVENVDAISPWRFTASLSPDMAAEEEGRHIDFNKLVEFSQNSPADAEYAFVEGAGGIMSPIDTKHTVLDWMKALKYPVTLVVGSHLGAISHALTACHTVLSSGLKLHTVIISESESSPVTPKRMHSTLRRFLPNETTIYAVNRLKSGSDAWKHAPNIAVDFI
jgi:dethiobiotin synthetase